MIDLENWKCRASQLGKIYSAAKGTGLSATAITYLEEIYSELKFGDREQIKSKYLDKGNFQESLALESVGNLLFGVELEKNDQFFENDFICGTPDAITNICIIDTKCSWSGKTFLKAITSPRNADYYLQLHGYMWLTDRKEAKLAYCLLDTPSFCNFGKEVIYESPISERIYIDSFAFDEFVIDKIIEKVKLCRAWLIEYDALIESKLAK